MGSPQDSRGPDDHRDFSGKIEHFDRFHERIVDKRVRGKVNSAEDRLSGAAHAVAGVAQDSS